MKITKGMCDYPILEVKIDEKVVGRSAAKVAQRLEDGNPRIYVWEAPVQKGLVIIHSLNIINEEIVRIVGERLYAAITS